jgi:hypothetical protein
MAAAKVAMVKTAKKKKSNRKTILLPAFKTSTVPTPLTKEVNSDDEEKDDDEATEEPLVMEERSVRRSMSPAAKRQ